MSEAASAFAGPERSTSLTRIGRAAGSSGAIADRTGSVAPSRSVQVSAWLSRITWTLASKLLNFAERTCFESAASAI